MKTLNFSLKTVEAGFKIFLINNAPCPFSTLADLQLDSGTSTKSFDCNILTYLIQSTQIIYDKVLVK